ncbi:uncharacterized protein DUF4169 [Yoonia maricola]|uniref:Uncharacterized protein DUF4169 n=1 Tax=Yoonia maricola TaxID=420999 RepID=A0A2M8WLC5_9RHOB|nr:DUF4169 family protein [Yoonia maricola]PJI91720.1 uncharacterized protein DUF4169 [Yoonia maricola]
MKPANLNQARKARTRADAKAKADANAVRFGRTKAEKVLDAARDKQASDRLAQLKFEDD